MAEAGLIAQDIQKVLPEAVREGGDGMLGVSYDGVVALLINSVKELTERVAYLESQLKG
uniref:Peptidase S74 domain-containing protein n=2 Tax=unclassified bacterial viruses TaxID=12333 RepID=A0AAU8EBA3_9VIRU